MRGKPVLAPLAPAAAECASAGRAGGSGWGYTNVGDAGLC
jgi:hypothetical protein